MYAEYKSDDFLLLFSNFAANIQFFYLGRDDEIWWFIFDSNCWWWLCSSCFGTWDYGYPGIYLYWLNMYLRLLVIHSLKLASAQYNYRSTEAALDITDLECFFLLVPQGSILAWCIPFINLSCVACGFRRNPWY